MFIYILGRQLQLVSSQQYPIPFIATSGNIFACRVAKEIKERKVEVLCFVFEPRR
jgi:hypothetical protein